MRSHKRLFTPVALLFLSVFACISITGCNNKPEIKPGFRSNINLQVYPNPALNYASIEVINQSTQPFTLYVFDTEGNTIVEQPSSEQRFSYSLRFQDEPKGNYQVIVKTQTAVIRRKLVKI